MCLRVSVWVSCLFTHAFHNSGKALKSRVRLCILPRRPSLSPDGRGEFRQLLIEQLFDALRVRHIREMDRAVIAADGYRDSATAPAHAGDIVQSNGIRLTLQSRGASDDALVGDDKTLAAQSRHRQHKAPQ